ncbi:MAG: DNRLRE domain-containing protein [Polyangiaceae bacterium]
MSLLLGAAATGCVESNDPSESDGDADLQAENVTEAQSALATCVTIQRGGTGNIEDTMLSADYPGWATGDQPSLYTGKSGGGGMNRSLIKADLSAIPAGAVITSATLSLSASWTDANNLVSVYPVLNAWSEATANASNFDAASGIGASAVASFAAGNGGTKSVDITGLVSQWVNGGLANNGVALQEPLANSHLFWSSETSMKPSLTVCYEPPPAGPYVWSKNGYHSLLAAGAAGELVGAGSFYGTVDFGAGPMSSTKTIGQYVSSTQDIYVAKYGPTGSILWSKKFGDEYIINPDNARDQNAQALTTDAAGNIYVTGTFKGVVVTASSPGYSETSFPGVYSLKLDPNGNPLFSSGHYAYGWGTTVRSVAADNLGGMVVYGDCVTAIAVGAYCEGGTFIYKDATAPGAKAWSRGCYPVTPYTSGKFNAMGVDTSGAAIMGATFTQAIQGGVDCSSYHSAPVPLNDAVDMIFVKHDNAGNLAWVKQFPVTGGAGVDQIVSDANNNLFLSIQVSTGTLTMGATTLGVGNHIVKVDPDFNVLWTGSLSGASMRKLAVLPSGDLAVSGLFSGSIDFGAGAVPGYGSSDYFLTKLHADGTLSGWGLTIGGAGGDTDMAMAVDGLGGMVLRGSLANSATFNFGQGLVGPNFLARVAP